MPYSISSQTPDPTYFSLPTTFNQELKKIEAKRTQLIPEIGKIEAKKTNWIEVKRTEAVFLKLLWSPEIDFKESIPPAYALADLSPYL